MKCGLTKKYYSDGLTTEFLSIIYVSQNIDRSVASQKTERWGCWVLTTNFSNSITLNNLYSIDFSEAVGHWGALVAAVVVCTSLAFARANSHAALNVLSGLLRPRSFENVVGEALAQSRGPFKRFGLDNIGVAFVLYKCLKPRPFGSGPGRIDLRIPPGRADLDKEFSRAGWILEKTSLT